MEKAECSTGQGSARREALAEPRKTWCAKAASCSALAGWVQAAAASSEKAVREPSVTEPSVMSCRLGSRMELAGVEGLLTRRL